MDLGASPAQPFLHFLRTAEPTGLLAFAGGGGGAQEGPALAALWPPLVVIGNQNGARVPALPLRGMLPGARPAQRLLPSWFPAPEPRLSGHRPPAEFQPRTE